MKKILASLNLAVTLVLLGILFILVNFLSSRHYGRWEMTKQHFTQVSDQTEKVLADLKQPVEVIVFYQPGHALYDAVRDLLKEYARRTDKLRVEYLDPDQDRARAEKVAQELQIDSMNLVIFKTESKHKYLPETDLAEYDYEALQLGTSPRLKAFKAESAFTSAILNVTQAEQPLVWVTTGHGEKSLDSTEPTGLAEFKRALEQQNMRLESVTLIDKPEAATDVKLIVIAGPTRRFTDAETALLERHLNHGGRVFALLDPLADTGLDALLEKWGALLAPDVVVDPKRQLPFVSPANLFVVEYLQHPIVERMRTLATLFPLARSVRPKTPAPEGLSLTPLAQTSPQGWGETTTDNEEFQFNPDADTHGPVPIALAVQAADPGKTRLVVIGDSDFVTNGQVGSAGNKDLATGVVHWLADQDALIGIGPKTIESVKLQLTEAQLRPLMVFCFGGLPLLCLGLGLATWWRRRA